MSKRDTRRAARHAKRYGHEHAAWPAPRHDDRVQAAQPGGDTARARKLQPQSRRR